MWVDNPALKDFRADPYSEILTSLVEEYKPEIFIASATTLGRTVMPICMVKLETGLTADCTGLDIDLNEKTPDPNTAGHRWKCNGHHQNPFFPATDVDRTAKIEKTTPQGTTQNLGRL